MYGVPEENQLNPIWKSKCMLHIISRLVSSKALSL